MARGIKFDEPLTPRSNKFGRSATAPPSRPGTSDSNVSFRSRSPATPGMLNIDAAANALLDAAASPPLAPLSALSRSQSPLSSVSRESPGTGFTAVNHPVIPPPATILGSTPVFATTRASTPSRPGTPSTPLPGQPGTKEFVFKPYPHDGFPDGCFTHSNYEYRQYKGATAPPEWKPFMHDPFPPDTFNHSNYSYRQGGFMGKRATPPPTTPGTMALTQPATAPITMAPVKMASELTAQAPNSTTARNYVTPNSYISAAGLQIYVPSPATILSTSMLPPFGSTPRVLPQPLPQSEQLTKKRKFDAPRPLWTPSGSFSPASVGGATNGSAHFASPPKTPESPKQSNPKNTTNIDEDVIEDGEQEGEEEDNPQPEGPAPIAFSKKKVPVKRRPRSPSPDTEDRVDPDDEFNRPSVLTLRPWEEEDGTISMVQDFRMLIHGRLHVGKVQTEW
jgi:hypothetical protein